MLECLGKGGGYAQVVPMEDINLHFTGDFHAIGAANNLLCAMVDNHIHQGNELNIDPKRIIIKRAVDMNDRFLRQIVGGLGARANGNVRQDGFDITVASEVMAVLCLATSIENLKERLGNIIIGYTYNNEPIKASDLKAEGAMTALLRDALMPNLVQTLEGTPAFVHGGPFANIAHGCNSVMATRMALSTADYVVTEAGFGADLGAEKFLDIKCRAAHLVPDAVIIVATIRALKMHGGLNKEELKQENLSALKKGMPNLLQHVENIRNIFGLNCAVAINRFPSDTESEIALVKEECENMGIKAVLSEVWEKGGEGGIELAEETVKLCDMPSGFNFAYDENDSLEDKIYKISTKIYHADGVTYSPEAKRELNRLQKAGYGNLPVCMAKTQYSFSDNPKLLGAPANFKINVSQVKISAGAGFVVALTGDIMTMPGLPKKPSAENIDVDSDGRITGLF